MMHYKPLRANIMIAATVTARSSWRCLRPCQVATARLLILTDSDSHDIILRPGLASDRLVRWPWSETAQSESSEARAQSQVTASACLGVSMIHWPRHIQVPLSPDCTIMALAQGVRGSVTVIVGNLHLPAWSQRSPLGAVYLGALPRFNNCGPRAPVI